MPYDSSASILIARLPSMSTTEKRVNGLVCCGSPTTCQGAVGALPIDVRKSQIAFLAADGHKWMCGTEGCALFYAAAEHRDKLDVLENGWTNVERRGKFILAPTDLLHLVRKTLARRRSDGLGQRFGGAETQSS